MMPKVLINGELAGVGETGGHLAIFHNPTRPPWTGPAGPIQWAGSILPKKRAGGQQAEAAGGLENWCNRAVCVEKLFCADAERNSPSGDQLECAMSVEPSTVPNAVPCRGTERG
ncbi:hypothetical protein MA16_Dca016727 [Dendrobium catenatum]|uniref:Uncharacterized protein n=1 Tax=Dendrobium catenatum TaxID=906689 RepID=A0A2I0VJJ4_9ASPA|nr:hypothetical protein MA16_Dca016727 [Dendrobium catenatum]